MNIHTGVVRKQSGLLRIIPDSLIGGRKHFAGQKTHRLVKEAGLGYGDNVSFTVTGEGKGMRIEKILRDDLDRNEEKASKQLEKAMNFSSSLQPPRGLFPSPAVDDPDFYTAADVQLALGAVIDIAPAKNLNVRFTGPQGTGKTTLAAKVAFKLGWDFIKVDCGTIREAADWFSRITASNGSTKAVPTLFAYAITRPKTVILLDEMNRTPADVLNALFGALDEHGFVWEEDLKTKIVRAPQTLVLATLNQEDTNVATFEQDSALIDRFPIEIRLEPLSAEDTALVLMDKMGTDKVTALMLGEISEALNAMAGTDISRPVSMRSLMAAHDFIEAGLSHLDALKVTVAGMYSRDGGGDSEYAVVVKAIRLKLGMAPE